MFELEIFECYDLECSPSNHRPMTFKSREQAKKFGELFTQALATHESLTTYTYKVRVASLAWSERLKRLESLERA